MSDLLNLPTTAGSKPRPKTGRARVLTSNECLSLLKEKEEKIKQEALEKEKRQQERLAKKKEKEEQQEKAGKQSSKTAKKVGKETSKREKQLSRCIRLTTKRPLLWLILAYLKSLLILIHWKSLLFLDLLLLYLSLLANSQCPSRKRVMIESNRVETIFSVTCCVCFGLYYDDFVTAREWLQFTCERWIHEDCVDVVDNGKLCPFC